MLSIALKLLAQRWLNLTEELKNIDKNLKQLTHTTTSNLVSQYAVGSYVAAKLLVTAGETSKRLNKSSFAALCGVSPIEASSGKTVRQRLNRGGSKIANNAIWTINQGAI